MLLALFFLYYNKYIISTSYQQNVNNLLITFSHKTAVFQRINNLQSIIFPLFMRFIHIIHRFLLILEE